MLVGFNKKTDSVAPIRTIGVLNPIKNRDKYYKQFKKKKKKLEETKRRKSKKKKLSRKKNWSKIRATLKNPGERYIV